MNYDNKNKNDNNNHGRLSFVIYSDILMHLKKAWNWVIQFSFDSGML